MFQITPRASAHFAALLADSTLTAEQRQALAQARTGLSGATREQIESSLATLPADSPAQSYKIIWPQLPVSMPVIMPAPNRISLSLKVSARGWQRPRNTC